MIISHTSKKLLNPQQSHRSYLVAKALIIFLIVLSNFHSSFAEGTKQLRPNYTDKGSIQIFDGATLSMATFGCIPTHRLYIHICTVGERVYYGFGGISNTTTYYRIKDPTGVIVAGGPVSTQLPTAFPAGQPGFITNNLAGYNHEVAGPSATVVG